MQRNSYREMASDLKTNIPAIKPSTNGIIEIATMGRLSVLCKNKKDESNSQTAGDP